MKHIVLIAGGSGSGKTTFSKASKHIIRENGGEVLRIPMDAYYKPKEIRFKRENPYDLDCPDAFDLDLLAEQLEALLNGETVDRPRYEMKGLESDRTGSKMLSGEQIQVIIIEGILTLTDDVFNKLSPILEQYKVEIHRIFVEVDEEEMLQRRIERDKVTRNATPEQTREFNAKFVQPAFEKYVKPTKKNAEVITNGNSPLRFFGKNKYGKELHYPDALVEQAAEITSSFTLSSS